MLGEIIAAIVIGIIAGYLGRQVLAADAGSPAMQRIARAIQTGAAAYLHRQMRTIAVFIVLLTVVLFVALPVPQDALHNATSLRVGRSAAFVMGAAFSGLAGYAGMWLAVRANVRTAQAARESGVRRAMRRSSSSSIWRSGP